MIETAYYRGQCDTLTAFLDKIAQSQTESTLIRAWVLDVSTLCDALDAEREQNAISVADQVLALTDDAFPILTKPMPAPYEPYAELEPLSVAVFDPQPTSTEDPQEATASQSSPPASSPSAETKTCPICLNEFPRPAKCPPSTWANRTTCGNKECAVEQRKRGIAEARRKPRLPEPVALEPVVCVVQTLEEPQGATLGGQESEGVAEARAYIQQCVMSKKPINIRQVEDLTGFSPGVARTFMAQVQDSIPKNKPVPSNPSKIAVGFDTLIKKIYGPDDDDEPDIEELEELEKAGAVPG